MPEQQSAAATPPAAPAAPAATVAPAESGTQPAQNPAEQAPAAQPGSEAKPDTEQDDPEKKRQSRRFERRLDRAYRRAAEAEARERTSREELARLRQTVQPDADPEAPKLENFKTIEEFTAAREKYAADRALKQAEAKRQNEARQKDLESVAEVWSEKAERGTEKYEDFDEVVGDVQPTTPWAVAAMEAENAEDIMYWLGKNMKEARRIAALAPRAQVREIGRLEEKLLANPPTKPKTPSKAPAPITPLTGTAPVVTDVPSEADDIAGWIKKRQKQVYGSRK